MCAGARPDFPHPRGARARAYGPLHILVFSLLWGWRRPRGGGVGGSATVRGLAWALARPARRGDGAGDPRGGSAMRVLRRLEPLLSVGERCALELLAEPMWSARPARNCIACLPPVKAVGPRRPPQKHPQDVELPHAFAPPEAGERLPEVPKKHHHRAPPRRSATLKRGLAHDELPPPVGAVVLPGAAGPCQLDRTGPLAVVGRPSPSARAPSRTSRGT